MKNKVPHLYDDYISYPQQNFYELFSSGCYYLVWYNVQYQLVSHPQAVVPGYYLVWYNCGKTYTAIRPAVVPGYYLVWYNDYGGMKYEG